MNEKDKIILTGSVNAIVTRIPYLGLAWDMANALLGAGLKLREKRALEWVELIRDNPMIFSKNILENEYFQDGFVYLLGKYIAERNEKKRKTLKNILSGFANSDNLEDFELERLSAVAGQITVEEMKILLIFTDGTVDKWASDQGTSRKMGVESYNCLQYGKLILSGVKGFTEFEDENYTFEKFTQLTSLGILVQPVAHVGGIGSGYSNNRFKISEFGNHFIRYLDR